MLVLCRNVGQRIFIGEGEGRVTATVLDAGAGRVRLGFDAPASVRIDREEVADRIEREGRRP